MSVWYIPIIAINIWVANINKCEFKTRATRSAFYSSAVTEIIRHRRTNTARLHFDGAIYFILYLKLMFFASHVIFCYILINILDLMLSKVWELQNIWNSNDPPGCPVATDTKGYNIIKILPTSWPPRGLCCDVYIKYNMYNYINTFTIIILSSIE